LLRIFAKAQFKIISLYRFFSILATKYIGKNVKKSTFFQCKAHTKVCGLEYYVIEIKTAGYQREALAHKIHTSCGKHRRFSMNCCNQGNVTLWILIALLVLGTKDGVFCSGIFNGCGLPIVAALLFCLYKNGTLSALLTPPCNCGCCH
jgi:hypothetical protein